jgi:hypothetical protein
MDEQNSAGEILKTTIMFGVPQKYVSKEAALQMEKNSRRCVHVDVRHQNLQIIRKRHVCFLSSGSHIARSSHDFGTKWFQKKKTVQMAVLSKM